VAATLAPPAAGKPRPALAYLDVAAIALMALAGLALRLHRLGNQNVWWDEGYSVYLARKGLVALALETAGDVHPPLHYWLLHFWTRLAGESEFAVRFSSVWFGVVGICLTYWLGRRLLGRQVGLVAALLLATSRFHVEWSQQIRMYTLIAVVAMLSIALTIQLWEAPKRRLWIGYVAVTTFGLYTLYLSALVPLVESLATALLVFLPVGGRRLSPRFLARWVAAEVASLALYLPWIVVYLRAPHVIPIATSPTHIGLLTFLQASATAFPLGVSAYLDRYTPATLAALALLALSIPAILQARRKRTGVLLGLLLVLPPVVVYALSFPNPVYYSPNLSVRYLFVSIPAYHLLLAAAIVWLWGMASPTYRPPSPGGKAESDGLAPPSRAGKGVVGLALRAAPAIVASAFLAGAFAWSLSDYYPGRWLRDDYQTVVRYLEAYARPGDAVVLNSDRDWPIFLYYYAGGLTRYGVGSLEPITPAGAADLLSPILAKHGSVWLLTSDNAYDSDPAGHVPAWLGEHAHLVGEVAGLRRKMALYSTDPSRTVAEPASVRPDRAASATFDGGLAALGYDLAVPEVAPGDALRLAVYWRAPGALPADAQVALRLVDRQGTLYRDLRAPLRTAYPPDRWRSGQVVRADYVLPVPAAMPAGDYTLALGVVAGGRDLPLAGGSGVSAALQTVRVVGAAGAPLARPAPSRPTDLTLGGRLRLAGYDLALAPDRALSRGIPARADLVPGLTLRIRLYWEDLQAVDRPYTVFVQLVGPTSNPATGNPVWAQRDAYPQAGKRPTVDWVPGEVIPDEYELTVPPNAPAGRYYLQVGLYDLASGQRLPVTREGKPAGDSVVLLEGQLD